MEILRRNLQKVFGKRIGSCETAILGERDIEENLPLTQANFVTY